MYVPAQEGGRRGERSRAPPRVPPRVPPRRRRLHLEPAPGCAIGGLYHVTLPSGPRLRPRLPSAPSSLPTHGFRGPRTDSVGHARSTDVRLHAMCSPPRQPKRHPARSLPGLPHRGCQSFSPSAPPLPAAVPRVHDSHVASRRSRPCVSAAFPAGQMALSSRGPSELGVQRTQEAHGGPPTSWLRGFPTAGDVYRPCP